MWHEERLLIDGDLVDAQGGKTYETENPATGEVLGTVADATVEDAQRAIAAARRAFDETTWATDVAFRSKCLHQLHKALEAKKPELQDLLVAEVGAPVMLVGDGPQLGGPLEIARYYADLTDTYSFTEDLGETEVRGEMHRRWIEKEPAGVVAAIVPYNYPVQITLAKLMPALAAGCTVIVKGPPQDPWVTASLGKIIAEDTDIPAGVVNVLTGQSVEVGEVLTTHPDVDMVSFTGSTAVGRAIAAAASSTVKKVFLELGGKSAFVVLDDADVGLAAMLGSFMVCSHAGQGCAIPTRMLVPAAKLDEFAETTVEMLKGVPYGDPSDPAMMMGPLISAQQRDKVESMVRAAEAEGGKVLLGGQRPDHLPNGYFYEPTLVVGVDNSAAIAQDEVFGPVMTMLPYQDDDDAVRIANDSIFGLSAAVVSNDDDRATQLARRLRAGTVSINGGMYYGPDVPFGGYKQSGVGREMGVAGLEEYLELKSLALPIGS